MYFKCKYVLHLQRTLNIEIMNKAFTKEKELILDDNYKIVPDSDYGVILVFLTEKKNKKDELVPFEQKYYFTRIAQALNKYVDLSLNTSNTMLELIQHSKRIYDIVDNIDKTFKQF